MKTDLHIGILALQGNFEQHQEVLRVAESKIPQNVFSHLVTNAKDLMNPYDALILPGGESSTMKTLLHKQGLFDSLQRLIYKRVPIFATCAGTILLAQYIHKESFDPLGPEKKEYDPMAVAFSAARISVNRNGYGRQVFSFSANIETTMGFDVAGMFIRAPVITEVGEGVEVLGYYKEDPVIVMQDSMLMTTFHPEAVDDDSLHCFFLKRLAADEEKL